MQKIDISNDFETMDVFEFHNFLRNLSKHIQDELLVIIHTDAISKAKRLKALREKFLSNKMRFDMAIHATKEEYQQELNVFASGIQRIEK